MVALFLAALAISALYAYYTMFSFFAAYDDEGFILISLKFFFQGHALYDEVFSVYQPFFYLFNSMVFGLTGAALGHDSIRLLTIVLWLLGAALNAFITYRLTSSGLLALAVLVVSVPWLDRYIREPGHPQALAYVLVAAMVALIAAMDRLPRTVFALATGLLVGLLLMTKINVGVYALLPVGLAFAAATPGRLWVWVRAVIGTLMIALPAMIMHSRLTEVVGSALNICGLAVLALAVLTPLLARGSETARIVILAGAGCLAAMIPFMQSRAGGLELFCSAVLLTLSVCSIVLLSRGNRPAAGLTLRQWIWALLGGAVATGATFAVILLRGTSLSGLMDGLVRISAMQSTIFYIPMKSGLAGAWLGLAGLAACCGYLWVRGTLAERRWTQWFLAGGKLVFGFAVLMEFAENMDVPLFEGLPHFWMIPFAWLTAASETKRPAEQLARLTLAAVAVMQPLIAYPVAGTQLIPASALMSVVAAVCLADAIRTFLPRTPSILQKSRWLRLALVGFVAFDLLLPLGRQALERGEQYAALTSLNLPGASRLRLIDRKARLYQELVRPLSRPETETFLTLPGLNSLYFWAQKDPPTGLNVTTWMTLLDDRCQERIWEAANKHPGLMAVRNKGLVAVWTQGRPFDRLPLVRHIDEHFRTVRSIYGYELMVRR